MGSTTLFSDGQSFLQVQDCDITSFQLAGIINNSAKKSVMSECSTNVILKLTSRPSTVKSSKTITCDLKDTIGNPIVVTSAADKVRVRPEFKDSDTNKVAESKPNSGVNGKQTAISSSALCSNCGKNFFSNFNLKRHMSSCKLCPEFQKSPRYHCECGRSYSQDSDLKKHKTSCQNNRSKCKKCLFSGCNLVFYHRSQLANHMKKDHSVHIQDPKVINFDSLDLFREWKEREEEQTYTYYSKQTGANVTGVSVNTYYVCQHDGSDRTHGSSPRKTGRRNKKGRVKTGRLCWSQMNVKEFRDGRVRVTYFPSHTHPVSAADTEHHPLPSSISSEIKRRISDIGNEGEDTSPPEYPELKKSRKKSFGMNLRALRALARKNRKLFRITAEAMKGAEDAKPMDQIEESNVGAFCDENHSVLIVPAEDIVQSPPSRDEIIQNCSTILSQLRLIIESPNMSDDLLTQVQASLGSLFENCQEALETGDGPRENLSELTEVLYQPDSDLTDQDFAVGDVADSHLHIKQEKTVYQVVAVKDEPSGAEGLLYQNAVGLVPSREFIIISNDHAQIFQPVDSLGLS